MKYLSLNTLRVTLAVLTAVMSGTATARADLLPARLTGHLPRRAIAQARLVSRVAAKETVALALTLPLKDPQGLTDFLQHLYTPGDQQYGHFLTPQQFTERFGPSAEDYQAVQDFAKQQGLTITHTHPNRLLLDVTAPASVVETAFRLHLQRYQNRAGRLFRAPDTDPAIPASLAGRLAGVIGLDTANVRKPHLRRGEITGLRRSSGLTPAQIKSAYGLQTSGATGAGQTIALFELDGYTPSDIRTYESTYGLGTTTLQNILVDGAPGTPGDGADEVTLDIEMSLALAPGVSKVLVYETPNLTDTNILDGYARIANDNLAEQVSTSWGSAETTVIQATLDSENAIFQQMAAQGQSVLSASGDNGAYDDPDHPNTPTVDDPASQPYVTGVGGTTLTLSGGAYGAETAWGDPTDTTNSPNGSGSGGGFSTVWPVPPYQKSIGASFSGRSVPDVALNADPNTGYAIYYGGSWHTFGGTSTAAPLWAGLTALVNQQRVAQGLSSLGFLNPAVYQIGTGSHYAADFHDIATGNNLLYDAVSGYDQATGWGTPLNSGLMADLIAYRTASANPGHLLWVNTNGAASIWNLGAADPTTAYKIYGPYAGWTPKCIAQGPDGSVRLLWTCPGGLASVWNLADPHPDQTYHLYGPYPGWSANALCVGPDNAAHLLWDNADGTASVWSINADGTFTYHIYGPYSGWSANAVSAGANGNVRLLWNCTTGAASIWNLGDVDPTSTYVLVGPYSGWSVKRLSVGPDNAVHLLWDNPVGLVSLWNLSDANPAATCILYGPYGGWSGQDLSIGSDGKGHLLWDNIGGDASLWSLGDTNPAATYTLYGPYSGWTAISLAASQ